MGRLTIAIGLLVLSLYVLVFVDDNAVSEAAACGAPPPTATPGPPTATMIPPTASPEPPPPTADFGALPVAKAPPGLHAIAACQTDDQVRAMLILLDELLVDEGWEISPFNPSLPPEVRLGMWLDPTDNQRTIGVGVLGDGSPHPSGGVAHGIARGHLENPRPGATITTDGELVWTRYERDGNSYLDWGAVGGAYRFTIWASYPVDLESLLDTFARAAEHACYPDCQ